MGHELPRSRRWLNVVGFILLKLCWFAVWEWELSEHIRVLIWRHELQYACAHTPACRCTATFATAAAFATM